MHFPREHPNPQHIPAAKPLRVQVPPPKARPRHGLRAARGWCGPAQQGGAWRAGHQMRGDFGGCTFRTYRSGPTGGPGPAMSFALCSQGGGGVKGEQRPYPTEGGEMTTQIQVLASKPVFGWPAPTNLLAASAQCENLAQNRCFPLTKRKKGGRFEVDAAPSGTNQDDRRSPTAVYTD